MENRLFAIGDIHGCFGAFEQLIMAKIKLRKTDKLILLGDLIDRGPQSKEVVDLILDLLRNGFDIITLMGNHEDMMLNALDNEKDLPLWLYNNGYATLGSFGIKTLKDLDERYVLFFRQLRLYYSYRDFLFVHAGFNDLIRDPFTDKVHMLWTCNRIHQHPLLKDKTIIHGHKPITVEQCQLLVRNRNQTIDIDTGCVYSNREGYGRLTALELYSFQMYSVHNGSFNQTSKL